MRAALIIAAGVGGLIWYQRMELLSSIRGLRNKNPLNIEKGDDWQGLAVDQSSDERFAVFVDPRYGIRAAARILNSYGSRGINTINSIVATWAPSFENNVDAYAASVAGRAGIPANEPISQSDYPAVLAAMIHHENGVQPYSMALIVEGVNLA